MSVIQVFVFELNQFKIYLTKYSRHISLYQLVFCHIVVYIFVYFWQFDFTMSAGFLFVSLNVLIEFGFFAIILNKEVRTSLERMYYTVIVLNKIMFISKYFEPTPILYTQTYSIATALLVFNFIVLVQVLSVFLASLGALLFSFVSRSSQKYQIYQTEVRAPIFTFLCYGKFEWYFWMVIQ